MAAPAMDGIEDGFIAIIPFVLDPDYVDVADMEVTIIRGHIPAYLERRPVFHLPYDTVPYDHFREIQFQCIVIKFEKTVFN
jgi:hypothetical protein